MSYSIKAVIHPDADKNGLHKIRIQVLYNRMKIYAKTEYKVAANHFDNGEVINMPLKAKINSNLRNQVHLIEGRLIDGLRNGIITKLQLKNIVEDKVTPEGLGFNEFITKLRKEQAGRLSEGVLKHYQVIADKVIEYDAAFHFSKLSITWLNGFEASLRKPKNDNGRPVRTIGGNTLHSNMKMLKTILYKAATEGLVSKAQFEDYVLPKYTAPIVEYLTEAEITRFHDLVQVLGQPGHKLAGYYFLLSCYAGYRISDAKRFNAVKMVQEGSIILRTKKNKTVVSIPIYDRLQAVLDYIHDKPLYLSEGKVREFVKDIAKMAGINKHVKYHMSRHSFAMLLRRKGFSLDEVAELLGDSPDVARVYARISNEQLAERVRERL
jgi:site-specific recombinase XerD